MSADVRMTDYNEALVEKAVEAAHDAASTSPDDIARAVLVAVADDLRAGGARQVLDAVEAYAENDHLPSIQFGARGAVAAAREAVGRIEADR